MQWRALGGACAGLRASCFVRAASPTAGDVVPRPAVPAPAPQAGRQVWTVVEDCSGEDFKVGKVAAAYLEAGGRLRLLIRT